MLVFRDNGDTARPKFSISRRMRLVCSMCLSVVELVDLSSSEVKRCSSHGEAGKMLSVYCCRHTRPSLLQHMGNSDDTARCRQQGIVCVHVMGSAAVFEVETHIHQETANIHGYLGCVSQVRDTGRYCLTMQRLLHDEAGVATVLYATCARLGNCYLVI